ncbi:MAG: pyridoxamine 5'-phosphate oxidase family protein, partial [Hyphomicrobium sp.]|nr:pyridoxamine 5'-phosphate oxidase family protein [Hyphomicrobium sp.]
MSHDQAAVPGHAIEPGDFAQAAEPFALFEAWLAEAARHEPNDPNAMALATVDAEGHPNLRMVLLKAVDPADHPARG